MNEYICITILQHFGNLTDPRQPGKVLYPLIEVLFVALCASLCGVNTFVDMELFGNAKLEFLKKFLPFENGIPSHDTFGSVFANLDARQFNNIFKNWINSFLENIPEHIAIDGKTVKRSQYGDIPPVHIVSAYSTDKRLVLGQIKTDMKSNEITAIPKLLEMLSIAGSIITIDAMGCQREIAQQIIDKKGDYLLAVKKNQESLLNDIEITFKGVEDGTFSTEIYQKVITEKDHGRIETRHYSIISDPLIINYINGWPKLHTIGKVVRTCENSDKITEDIRYFICSKEININEFSKTVRSHWGIENSLHWVLDIVFREDDSRARKKNAAANFVTLKHITLNMLKNLDGKHSIRARRVWASWDDSYLYKALCATPIA